MKKNNLLFLLILSLSSIALHGFNAFIQQIIPQTKKQSLFLLGSGIVAAFFAQTALDKYINPIKEKIATNREQMDKAKAVLNAIQLYETYVLHWFPSNQNDFKTNRERFNTDVASKEYYIDPINYTKNLLYPTKVDENSGVLRNVALFNTTYPFAYSNPIQIVAQSSGENEFEIMKPILVHTREGQLFINEQGFSVIKDIDHFTELESAKNKIFTTLASLSKTAREKLNTLETEKAKLNSVMFKLAKGTSFGLDVTWTTSSILLLFSLYKHFIKK